jgi:fumarate hydratase class II
MGDKKFRTEKDSMGELKVPAEALYAAQTQRAINNFPISGQPMPAAFIHALGHVKHACAVANTNLNLIDANIADAIKTASKAVSDGQHDDQFPVDIFQTGSGTSTNMNANEVIANLASKSLGEKVHPNDHVNMSQSSNDVIPTTINVSACIEINNQLMPAVVHLVKTLKVKATEVSKVVKTGRTHLMDAMPITLEQELQTWIDQLSYDMERINDSMQRLTALPQGGTAVGTGINAHEDFGKEVAKALFDETGIAFSALENPFVGLAAQDSAVEMSGQLKTLAVTLMKIANDLRWMNSGPLAGIGEIELPALQPGSSIMPGKVNPVIPEAVAMVAAQVIGNDTTITVAGQSGNFQLNVMLPVIAANLLESIELLANASRVLADKTIADFKINEDNIKAALDRNPILVTALNRVIGYEQGAAIAKKAYAEGRAVIDVAVEMTDLSEEELKKLLDPSKLAHPND